MIDDSNYSIEDNVPIPDDFQRTPRKYPFHNMEVGQSVFIGPSYEGETQKQVGNRVAQARQAYQKRMAKQGVEVQFTQRMTFSPHDEGTFATAGYRVWRVK
tara:strand:- start:536 stop:838 length:303 start_codon:yes stop_codon:yes gene_type:complete